MADNKINVGGRLHSIATGNVLGGANEIFDDDKNKKQSDINTETYSLVNDVNERLSGLSPDQQSALTVAAKATNNETKLGYYVCGTEGNLAAKVISDATGYILSKGGSIKIKMTNANTANNATLNINSTGAKALYYDGERASAKNSWEAGETVEVYYDGTNFYANNVAGSGGDGVFDVSEKYPTSGVEGGNTYTLEGALAVLNANLPASKKKGGMSIKFVQSSDNKYVRYNLLSTSFTTDETKWAVDDESIYVDNPEFIYVKLDADGRILLALKTDGSVYYGAGVPQQIVNYINEKIKDYHLNQIVDFLDDLELGNKTLSELFGEKVDKEVGKSLIDSDYASSKSIIENPEWLQVNTDVDGKIISCRKKNGVLVENIGIESPTIDAINEEIEEIKSSNYRLSNHIIVAAYNASENDKRIADYVCDGIDDQNEINQALQAAGTCGIVTLTCGDFYVDTFSQYNVQGSQYVGIKLPWFADESSPQLGKSWCVTLQGESERGTSATKIHARQHIATVNGEERLVWNGAPADTQVVLIGWAPFVSYNTFNINNIEILIEDNEGNLNNLLPIICIDCEYLGGGDIHDIVICGDENRFKNLSQGDHYPVQGVVGLRTWIGSDTGTIHITKSVVMIGLYEAFQLGAEHHVLINCGGRFNYYCYTFGNYNYHSGTNEHPIVLINCSDENSQCYPLFARNGLCVDTIPERRPEHPLQSVTFIGFNLEHDPMMVGTTKVLAKEYRDGEIDYMGDWCGRVEYTDGGWSGNKVNKGFWANDGSGRNFRTLNLTHAPGGTSALRQTYLPNYMQHYFDTDLNKELIFNGTDWVDCSGNIIS